jgi:hypothetical protein
MIARWRVVASILETVNDLSRMFCHYDALLVISIIKKQRSSKCADTCSVTVFERMYISLVKVGRTVNVIAPQQLHCTPLLHWLALHYLPYHRPVTAQDHLAA